MKRTCHQFVLAALIALASLAARAADFDHAPWSALLDAHVSEVRGGLATEVDYAGMRKAQGSLHQYLDAMAAVSAAKFDEWPLDEQLAFLINAYNAWTVELVAAADPGIQSIKDIGSLLQSPWRKRFVRLLGREWTLDEVEHTLIRGSGRYRDPRVHFAVNCASIGCPALRREAYEGAKLEAQLDDATRRFLSDRTRNRLENGRLRVSRIFDWYADDFAKGWRGQADVGSFLHFHREALGLDPAAAARLQSGAMKIDYLPYDWRLNGAGASSRTG